MDASPVQSAISLASDLDKQLLALATGVLALTVTFYKDVDKTGGKSHHVWLYLAWALLLASTALGLFAFGKLVSLSLTPGNPAILNNLDGASIWALSQEISFFLALLFIGIYGCFVFASMKKAAQAKHRPTTVQ
jgi:hypothetical protein